MATKKGKKGNPKKGGGEIVKKQEHIAIDNNAFMKYEQGIPSDANVPSAKVYIAKESEESSVSRSTSTFDILGDYSNIPGELAIIAHPLDYTYITTVIEHSNSLRQNIDAYAANIDGHGHRFTPRIILDSDNIDEELKTNLAIARGLDDSIDIDDADVKELKEELQRKIPLEKIKLNFTFENIARDTSFITMREQVRHDYELTGNAYLEVIRDAGGRIAQLIKPQPQNIYHTKQENKFTPVTEIINTSKISTKERKTFKKYRRFVEVIDRSHTYFKEFGDPRTISRRTGKAYENVKELEKAEAHKLTANELIHFCLYSPRTTYGIPRWIGAFLSILGSRYAEQINFLYFTNKSIPPMMVTVSGGKLTSESVTQLQNYIENDVKGIRNFHKLLILECDDAEFTASGASNTGRPTISVKPMTNAIHNDALFQNYDKENINKTGQTFRLPNLLRGDSRDFNRACYDEQTETLTSNGWKRLGEFTKDDLIAAFNTETERIEYVQPAQLLVYDVEEPLLHFSNRWLDCMVTPNHTMLVRSYTPNGKFCSKRADEIPWKRYCLKTVAKGVTRGDTSLPHNDLKLLAYYLMFGWYSTARRQVAYTCDEKEASDIISILDSERVQYNVENLTLDRKNIFIDNIILHNLFENILEETLLNLTTPEVKEVFSIMQTVRDLPYVYRSACLSVVEALQIAATHAGFTASTNTSKNGLHRVTISRGMDRTMHGPPKVVQYKGKVYCFSVPNHGFFVTRRNGKIAIQGNTATSVLKFAEQQIFSGNRRKFDDIINRTVMRDIGAKYHTFTSNSPATTDPIDQATMVNILSKTGSLTPRDLRSIIESILNIDLKTVSSQPWMDAPYVFAISQSGAAFVNDADGNPVFTPGKNAQKALPNVEETTPEEESPKDQEEKPKDDPKTVSKLLDIASNLVSAGDNLEEEVIKVPLEIWKTFGIDSDD